MYNPLNISECPASRVLRNNTCNLSIICSYQHGWSWEFYQQHAEVSTIISINGKYKLASNFRPLKFSDDGFLSANKLALDDEEEFYLPLHLALAEGEDKIAKRMIQRYPSIVTANAVQCAVNFNQYSMVQYMLPLLDNLSDERRWKRFGKELPENLSDFEYDIRARSNSEIRCGIEYTIHSPERAEIDFNWSECPERDFFEFYSYNTFSPKWPENPDDFNEISLNALKYFISIPCYDINPHIKQCIRGVCESGRLDLAQALVPKLSFEVIGSAAAKAGQLCIIQWIYDAYPGFGFLSMWKNLVSCGHYMILQTYVIQDGWTFERLWEVYKQTEHPDHPSHGKFCAVDAEIDMRDVRMVRLLHSMGFPLAKIHPLSLEVTMYLHEHSRAINFSAFENAADILEGVHNLKLFTVPDSAAVKYLYDLYPDTQLSSQILDVAVIAGSLEMVKLLLEHCKVPLSERSLEWSIRYTQMDIAKYLCMDAGAKFSGVSVDVCFRQSDSRFLELLSCHFLQDLCRYIKSMHYVDYISTECIDYILTQPLLATPQFLYNINRPAARIAWNNRFDVLEKYLEKMGSSRSKTFLIDTIESFVTSGLLHVVPTLWHIGCKIWDFESEQRARKMMSIEPDVHSTSIPSPHDPYRVVIWRILGRN